MFELNGKYADCKVFTDNVSNETVSQLMTLLNQESVSGSKIRIMPDTHAGKGCVIGTTMTLKDKVIPNLVGVDIGCFTGDTKVWCSAGYYRTIKELAEKDGEFLTDSFDLDMRYFVANAARARKTRENAELVRVTYGGMTSIGSKPVSVRCTPDHKFLVSTNPNVYYDNLNTDLIWVEAKDLKNGMRLVADDMYIFVHNVEVLEEREDVYCLTVEETHNFSIEYGVIVHNCGMLAVKLEEKEIDLELLDDVIRKYVPFGGDVHDKIKPFKTSLDCESLRCWGKAKIREMLAYASVGTLGGGNHFIEANKDKDGNIWLVVHTGSRHLGLEVCDYYQSAGYEAIKEKLNNGSKAKKRKELIEKLKEEGRSKEISSELKKFEKNYVEETPSVPRDLAYVEDELFDDYIHDMDMVQKHASCNRAEIVRTILRYTGLTEVERFETIHNYIDVENMILRKGSVSAQKGEKLIIPINMRDGSLICIGKGNPDWNFSAPHGAGRLMSRSEAKELVSMNEYEESMKGIFTTCVNRSTLDESPMAYKPMQEIIENVQDTVEIVDIIKPIYNFKASE